MIINKKNLFASLCSTIILVTAGCLKNDSKITSNCVVNNTGVPTTAEIASLQTYLTTNNITATQDPRGFFYSIVNAGSGPAPLLSSTVIVKYLGKLENGNEFDHNQNPNGETFILGQLIKGWQLGIPLIRKGGSIKLYLPPTLGYGCNATGSIPPGANLIFTVDLVDVQ
jgi:FKBP-type peptidyl-prolyl cis-trans isomerase FkpA